MEDLKELENWLLQLKEQMKNQKKMIDEFKTERELLMKQIRDLNTLVRGIVSTYGEKGEKVVTLLEVQNEAMKSKLEKQIKVLTTHQSEFQNRVGIVESHLKTLDSDTKRLSSERKKVLKEFETLDRINKELSELEKWKHRAFERIDGQDKRVDDRMLELENLEERVENSLKALDEKFENAMKDQKTYLDGQIKKLELQMKKLLGKQQAHVFKVEEEIRHIISNELTPRLLKIDNALNQMKKMNIIFQGLRLRTEKLYKKLAAFKSNFENTEKDLNIKIQENVKRTENFEMKMMTFINELVQEYEKRFDMIRKELENLRHLPLEYKGKFKSKGFLNKIKKIFYKEDLERTQQLKSMLREREKRATELENRLRQQKAQIKKMLRELKSVVG